MLVLRSCYGIHGWLESRSHEFAENRFSLWFETAKRSTLRLCWEGMGSAVVQFADIRQAIRLGPSAPPCPGLPLLISPFTLNQLLLLVTQLFLLNLFLILLSLAIVPYLLSRSVLTLFSFMVILSGGHGVPFPSVSCVQPLRHLVYPSSDEYKTSKATPDNAVNTEIIPPPTFCEVNVGPEVLGCGECMPDLFVCPAHSKPCVARV